MKPNLAAGAAVVAACFVALAPNWARASESVFGLQFLGTSDETGDARARGLGVLGVALDDTMTALASNPAGLGGLRYMTFSFAAVAGWRDASTATASTQQEFARFPQLRAALPLFGKVVLATGYASLRNFRGDFALPPRSIDGLEYVQSFEREGSLYTIPVALAATLGSRVRVGASVDFLLGTIDEQWITRGGALIPIASGRTDEFHGTSTNFGVVVLPWPWLRVAGSWAPEFSADRERRMTIQDGSQGSTADPFRVETTKTTVQFPQVVRAGATVVLRRKLLLAGDALWREWPAYEGSLYEAQGVGDEVRIGAGLEYKRGLWSTVRAGVSRWTWGAEVGGNPVRETAVHFGLGVPLAPGKGGVHLAVEHAWVGSLAENGHEERVWRVVVSVSGQETWLRKAPRAR